MENSDKDIYALIGAIEEYNDVAVALEKRVSSGKCSPGYLEESKERVKAIAERAGIKPDELIMFHAIAAADTVEEGLEGLMLGRELFNRFKETGKIDGELYERLKQLES